MAVVGWGKPRIFTKLLDDEPTSWQEWGTPVEDSTTLETTKGDKQEAKIEGGENEDVKYNRNTYALTFNLRAIKDRAKPLEDTDGVIEGNYAVALQPEDPAVQGFVFKKSTASVEDSFSADEGGVWAYTFDALKPDDGGTQINWGVIAVNDDTIICTPVDGDEFEI